MVVQIQPEDEKLIEEKLRTGAFRSIDELIHSALVSLPMPELKSEEPRMNFAQFLLESPLPGSGLNLDRPKQYPRPIPL